MVACGYLLHNKHKIKEFFILNLVNFIGNFKIHLEFNILANILMLFCVFKINLTDFRIILNYFKD